MVGAQTCPPPPPTIQTSVNFRSFAILASLLILRRSFHWCRGIFPNQSMPKVKLENKKQGRNYSFLVLLVLPYHCVSFFPALEAFVPVDWLAVNGSSLWPITIGTDNRMNQSELDVNTACCQGGKMRASRVGWGNKKVKRINAVEKWDFYWVTKFGSWTSSPVSRILTEE